MKLLHVSQLVRITCAVARRFSKFWLAWRRAKFFSGDGGAEGCRLAPAANSAAEGSRDYCNNIMSRLVFNTK